MGEVYRARDGRLGRDVAIKIVAEHRIDRGAAAARFEREWRAIATLSHPNVVALYDVGSEGDLSYAVMEFLEGDSLDQLLLKEGVPWQRALDIGAGVALATRARALHERGRTRDAFAELDEARRCAGTTGDPALELRVLATGLVIEPTENGAQRAAALVADIEREIPDRAMAAAFAAAEPVQLVRRLGPEII